MIAVLPPDRPNPLVRGGDEALAALCEAADALDRACAAGDERAFAAVTTADYRRELAARLQAVDAELGPATLQAISAAAPQRGWLDRPVLATQGAGERAAIAVQRPDGDGAQLLEFVWDGRAFRLDRAHHAAAVRDRATARAAVAAAVVRQ